MRAKSILLVVVSVALLAGCGRSDANAKLAQRVAELERIVGSGTGNVVHARQYLIEDVSGNVHATLGWTKEGPALTLCDESGNNRAGLIVGKDGPCLNLSDENGKACAKLRVGKDGTWLILCDENGKTRAAVAVTKAMTPDGKTTPYPESSVVLFGPDGRVCWQAPTP